MNPWSKTSPAQTLAGLRQAQLNNLFLTSLRQKLPAVPRKFASPDDGYRKFLPGESSDRSTKVEFNTLSLFGK
jgi:hypothetical protein